MIDTERCPVHIGEMQCTLYSGHDTGPHPTPHHATVPMDALSPELGRLVAGWIDTVEAERNSLRRVRWVLYVVTLANFTLAIYNLTQVIGGA